MNKKILFLYLFFILLTLNIAYSETSSSSINWASQQWVKNNACMQNGNCTINQLHATYTEVNNSNVTGIVNAWGFSVNGTPLDYFEQDPYPKFQNQHLNTTDNVEHYGLGLRGQFYDSVLDYTYSSPLVIRPDANLNNVDVTLMQWGQASDFVNFNLPKMQYISSGTIIGTVELSYLDVSFNKQYIPFQAGTIFSDNFFNRGQFGFGSDKDLTSEFTILDIGNSSSFPYYFMEYYPNGGNPYIDFVERLNSIPIDVQAKLSFDGSMLTNLPQDSTKMYTNGSNANETVNMSSYLEVKNLTVSQDIAGEPIGITVTPELTGIGTVPMYSCTASSGYKFCGFKAGMYFFPDDAGNDAQLFFVGNDGSFNGIMADQFTNSFLIFGDASKGIRFAGTGYKFFPDATVNANVEIGNASGYNSDTSEVYRKMSLVLYGESDITAPFTSVRGGEIDFYKGLGKTTGGNEFAGAIFVNNKSQIIISNTSQRNSNDNGNFTFDTKSATFITNRINASTTLNVGMKISSTQVGSRMTISDNGYVPLDGYVLQVHADDAEPFLVGFFIDSVSSTTPAFSYYSDGNFFTQGTNSPNALYFYTNGYSNPRIGISGTEAKIGIGDYSSKNMSADIEFTDDNNKIISIYNGTTKLNMTISGQSVSNGNNQNGGNGILQGGATTGSGVSYAILKAPLSGGAPGARHEPIEFFRGNPATSLMTSSNFNVTGNLNVLGNMSYKNPFALFTSNQTFTVASANTLYPFTMNQTEKSYMISVDSSSKTNISFQKQGVYELTLSITTRSTAAGTMANIWFQKTNSTNGFENIPRSNTPYQHKSTNAIAIIPVSFLLNATTSDKYRVVYDADNTGVSFPYLTSADPVPETQSVVITVKWISELT